jgi:hypothetical protein
MEYLKCGQNGGHDPSYQGVESCKNITRIYDKISIFVP